ncbi:MAG: glutamyl-tRNA reductase [Planctomycetes bacterium]|nr:glutamyl-tRNA reductase [Planctomycetota bacterium]
MRVQVVYCNHHSADLTVREQLAFSSPEQLGRAYRALRASFPQTETVLLSTCNRVELYTAQDEEKNAPSFQQITEFLSDFHRIPLNRFVDDLLEQTGPDAVRHLFEVVTSLDSMVLGEPQIVNQVKEAYSLAQRNKSNGPLTNLLFQGAVRVSKRVRSETRLAEGRVSIASVAVGEFGKSIFDRFDDKTVLVIGAGEMAEETVRYLNEEGVSHVVVVNRSLERAEKLARTFNGDAAPYEQLDDWLSRADVIVSTTGADRPIVDAARFAAARKTSGGKPVFILDLGAPRDFDPAVSEVDDNVFLYDIDDLEATCRKNRQARSKEIEKARKIIAAETESFMHDVHHRATGSVIKMLVEKWHAIRRREMDALDGKLGHLDPSDRELIERTIERIINKLLHPPLTTLRDEAKQGTPHGLLDALKQLFRLKE